MVYSVFNFRRNTQVCLIIFFTFIAFAADPSTALQWATLVIFLALLYIADLMFMDQDWGFDPNYKNWARQQRPHY